MLISFKLNNTTLDKINNWSYSDLNGNIPFIISPIVLDGYGDISSITNWDLFGIKLKDFNFVRDRIKEITDLIGFDNLTTDEKVISAKYFVVGKTDRDSVLTEEEQYVYWSTLVSESQISRFKRWEEAKKYISYKLTPANSSDLAKSTSELCNDYINYNIITKVKDGISGLFDYLRGVEDFINNGYPSKLYWTQQDQNMIMDILENGNY